ncbi:MAG: flagellar protein FlaG [Tissierellaceae bacterium]|nr:flagellar protein FlaG [Tissierellaceae bacterium]
MLVEGVNSVVSKFSSEVRPVQSGEQVVQRPEVRTQQQPRHGEERKIIEEKRITEEDAINLIEKANKDFVVYDRRFEFSIHDATRQIMVKIIDVNTDEVIRELPPEKILDMVAALWEVAGIIVDRKI